MIVVALGAVLVTKAPSLVVECVGEGYYSIGPVTSLPILPALVVVVGVLTFALALKGQRLLSPLTAVCMGLFITSLTFWVPGGESAWRVDKYGCPFGWLVWFTGLSGMNQHIMGMLLSSCSLGGLDLSSDTQMSALQISRGVAGSSGQRSWENP